MAKTILIADDEPNQIATLEAFLSQRGYKIISASNGQQAFEKALQFLPNLVILDIMMPKMDGTEAATLLKQDARTISCIDFTSAGATVSQIQKNR